MFQKEVVEKILVQAEHMDLKYEMFGASGHKYRLNPPVDQEFVREMEKKYHFLLPEDYVQFITEVGDGGAGPDYGIIPFGNFLKKAVSPGAEKFQEAYRCSLGKAFRLRPMQPDEVECQYAFSSKAYERNPENYFAEAEEPDEYTLCNTAGYFKLGTHGCQWDFGLVTTSDRRGQIFDTDNEGGYCLAAYSFHEFYQSWLDYISDTERFCEKLEERRRIRVVHREHFPVEGEIN